MKASEIREMSVADIRERIEIEKANLDTMKKMKIKQFMEVLINGNIFRN